MNWCYYCALMCCPYRHSFLWDRNYRYVRSGPPAPDRPPRRMSREEFRNAIRRCYQWFYVWTMDGMGDGYYEFSGYITNGEDLVVTVDSKIFGYSNVYSIKCLSKAEAERLNLTPPSPGEIIPPQQQGPGTPGGVPVPSQWPGQLPEPPWGDSGWPGEAPGTGGNQSDTHGGQTQCPGQQQEYPWGTGESSGTECPGQSTSDWPLD